MILKTLWLFLCAPLLLWAQDVKVELITSTNQTYDVRGSFTVTAPIQVAWGVLSDYNHLPMFVSSMVSSNATTSSPGNLLVDQTMRGEVLFFSQLVHVKLSVKEIPPSKIQFVDLEKKDFKTYNGQWMLDNHGAQTSVVYTLNFKTNMFVPPFLEQSLVQGRIQQLLSEVKREIEKRQ